MRIIDNSYIYTLSQNTHLIQLQEYDLQYCTYRVILQAAAACIFITSANEFNMLNMPCD